MEIGANFLGLNCSESDHSFLINDTNHVDPYNPLISFNTSKQTFLTEELSMTAGVQAGMNYQMKKFWEAGLGYARLNWFSKKLHLSNISLGSSFNTRHYGGSGNRFGVWMAGEFELHEKFHIMAETILGDNSLCNTSIAFILLPKPYLTHTLGIQLPNSPKNDASLVFEFTYKP